jgi:tRNA1Val (adenine37-N6)-methyltransferase
LQCGANETLDVLLDGRVRIIQRRGGYRVNQDSLRLCDFVRSMPQSAGIDLGAGCGIVAIVLSLEKKIKHMVALELQGNLADLARRNVALNGLDNRIEVVQGDIRQAEELFAPHSFGLAVSNPPYRVAGRGRMSPSAEKAIARHERLCSFQDLVRAASYLLMPEGIFAFCQLRERWGEITEELPRQDLQIARRQEEGEVVLVEAQKLRI